MLVVPETTDGSVPEKTLDFTKELASEPADFETARTSIDEPAFWLYSSGSTGAPKGTKHVHGSMMKSAELYGQPVLGIREDDVIFSAAKFFFAYGLGNALFFPMSVGATTLLNPGRPTPALVFEFFAKYQPSIFSAVPTLLPPNLRIFKKVPPWCRCVRHPERTKGPI